MSVNNVPVNSPTISSFMSLIDQNDWHKTFMRLNTELSKHADRRVIDWPLMDAVSPLCVAAAYLIIVFVLCQLMKLRSRPFNVKWLSMLHNINLTLLSTYMFVEIIRQCFILNHYKLFANSVDKTEGGDGLARILYIFYISKIFEFFDTFIMCLKQNYRQITFLHMYHHCSIFLIWWIIVLFAPGGESYFSAMLNSFIHILMYSYYLASSLASKIETGKKPSPLHPAYYKKYMTRMQLTQFMCMLGQAVYDLFVLEPKELGNFPRFAIWILFYYMFTMLSLFGNFYIQAYKKGGAKRTDKQKKVQ